MKEQAGVVKIMNSTGQVCLQQSLLLHAGENTATFAANELGAGIYFMRIELAQQKSK